jgi:molecular chaperone GrpE
VISILREAGGVMIDNDSTARRPDDAGPETDREEYREEVESLPEAERQDSEQERVQHENEARIDNLMRALADADNARKRAERHAAEVRQYAIDDFARDLLAVADNLQRAIASAETTADGDGLLDGVRATAKLLESVLERHGVTRIEARGVPFDPRRHEAIAVIDDATREPGEIVDVAEEGYMIRDRLLRPARVLVNNPDRKPASDIYGRAAGS